MKKTIIIAGAALVLSAGVLSQVKVSATPSVQQTVTVQKSISTDRKDLGTAD